MLAGYNHYESGVDWVMIASCRNRWNLRTWIELGTGYGYQSVVACDLFDKVHAVEICYDVFLNQLPELKQSTKAISHYGSSVDILPTILDATDKPAFIYIDSHWISGNGDRLATECPLLEELAIISSWAPSRRSVVCVDNASMIINPPEPPHKPEQWPNIDQVIAAMRKTWNFVTLVADQVYATPEPLIQRLA